MIGDRAIRRLAAGVVLAVAGFAAVVSFTHIYDLGVAHGQAGTAARLLPLSVDGLILAASLVMLHEARNKRPAPPLARWMLLLGVAATVSANVAYGLAFGPLGAVISAWPAVAFIGSAEMAIGLARRSRIAPEPHPAEAPPEAPEPASVPASVPAAESAAGPASAKPAARTRTRTRKAVTNHAAEMHFAVDLAAGQVPSQRRIQRELRVGQARSRALRDHMEHAAART